MAKRLPSPKHADTLSLNALRGLVTGLLERSKQAEGRLAKLEVETIQLQEENAALRLDNTRLKVENQLLRDEIARRRTCRRGHRFVHRVWTRQRMPRSTSSRPARRSRAERSWM